MLRRSLRFAAAAGSAGSGSSSSSSGATAKRHHEKVHFTYFPKGVAADELCPQTLNFHVLSPYYVPWFRKVAQGMTILMKWAATYLVTAPNSIIPDRPKEELYKMRRVLTVNGKAPWIGDNCFLAPCAGVFGDVYLARKNFIGYNTIVRADRGARIEVGESSNIQDKAIVTGNTTIGKWVSIEPMAIVDSADIGSNSMVGAAAIVMKGARIESGCMLCAASVLKSGETIRSGEIWAGNPAQKIGTLNDKEKEYIIRSAKHNVLLAIEHHDSWAMAWEDWDDIRLARETWAIWADDMYELRIRPHYIREPPNPKSRRHQDITTIQDCGEGRVGSAEIPKFEGTAPGHL